MDPRKQNIIKLCGITSEDVSEFSCLYRAKKKVDLTYPYKQACNLLHTNVIVMLLGDDLGNGHAFSLIYMYDSYYDK